MGVVEKMSSFYNGIYFHKIKPDVSCFLLSFFYIFVSLFLNRVPKVIENIMVADCTTVWNDCLDSIKDSVGEENFNTWFKPIVPLRVEGDVLTIQVPSQFFYEWLEDNYVPILKKAVHNVLGQTGRLEYSVIVDSGNTQNPPVTVSYPNGMGGKRSNGNGMDSDYSLSKR